MALFIAPELDLTAILQAAARREQDFRFWLRQRQQKEQEALCPLSSAKLLERIVELKKEQQRQLLLWQGVHKNYVRSVRYHLYQRQSLGGLDSRLLSLVLEAFGTVEKMQVRRQEQLTQVWTAFLSLWLQQKLRARACAGQLKQNLKEPAAELMAPYYLAFYRFLRLLPVVERSRFLFRYHAKFR